MRLLFAKTVKELNNVVKQNNFPPIIASRNYAYAAIAAYETIVLGDNRFVSLAGQVKGLTSLVPQPQLHPDYRYAALLAYCKVGQAVTFPEGSMKYYLAGLQAEADRAGMTDPSNPIAKPWQTSWPTIYGVEQEQINMRKQERQKNIPLPQKKEGGCLRRHAYIEAMEPNWNKIRPMVMDSATSLCRPVRQNLV